jgi:ankyrin repeat protein
MSTTCTWVQIGNNDYEALMQAVVEGDVQRIAAALKPNIEVDAMYGDGLEGEALIYRAACLGHVHVIRYLLGHDAEVDVRNRDQFSDGTSLSSQQHVRHKWMQYGCYSAPERT